MCEYPDDVVLSPDEDVILPYEDLDDDGFMDWPDVDDPCE